MTLGWRLAPEDRASLLRRFPPRYREVVADHVTHGHRDKAPALPVIAHGARVVGHADDGTGVEALVVEIDASSARWDGSRYHLTWSLEDGRTAHESNRVIATWGWAPIDDGPRIALEPAEWP